MAYVYIIECSDGSLYTGWTNDVPKRIEAHNQGKGAKYTRNRLPVSLRYIKEFSTRQEAMKEEYRIKQLSREQKIGLIREAQAKN